VKESSIMSYRLMGILNVTPDSFSDGGLYLDTDSAIAHGVELSEQGAHILDVGGESTRPGADPVDEPTEMHRVIPVIAGLTEDLSSTLTPVQISIDTSKMAVAEEALRAGATLVNDVTALRADPLMAGMVATAGADCCLMHMQGTPRTMQRSPSYDDVVSDVKSFLEERLSFAVSEGIAEERVLLDPGIGFGKTPEQSMEAIAKLGKFKHFGLPILVGASRKRFINSVSPSEPMNRIGGSIAAHVMAYINGANMIRTHDVAETIQALRVAAALRDLQ
jgi:dihydropteroate synthase